MIKINSPFKLVEPPPRYLGAGFRSAPFTAPRARQLLLSGLRVCLQFGGRDYELSNTSALACDGFRSRGFGWTRKAVPLIPGVLLEQQILLANGGNTVALCWRLTGERVTPVSLTAIPVFSTEEPASSEPFKFDAEGDGGRLTWQPYHLARKIIADTNGRCSGTTGVNVVPEVSADLPNISVPGVFEFDLGRRPAVLIFSVEPEEDSVVDPFLGGFLAELAQPTLPTKGEYLRSLAAA